MTLSAGDKLGPYEITGSIGQGGMGEVYRARDTRLGRDVAVKVSTQRFGERFEREARVVSSLNHPNVCTLHDVGDNYLVMELVDGQTLSERIRQGPVPLDEALAIARQIAGALEAAHQQGIVHRDLKPGNVMLKEDGSVKVLDFGLAKAGPHTAYGVASPDPEASPTISIAATQAGVVLGTAAYMAPEQARGKAVDKRADIWAFGVVLFEMVTGRKLFAGEDLTDTLAAVVREQPDLSAAPAELQPLLEKCLQKDPRKRLRDISGVDAYLELGKASAALHAHTSVTSPGRRRWLIPVGAAVAAAAVTLIAVWAATTLATEPAAPQVVRTVLELDEALLADASIGISPDGSAIVYPTEEGLRLWRIDSFDSTLVAGTAGARMPFFSPDGQQIAYFDGSALSTSALRAISVNGGPSRVIVDQANTPVGARWLETGEILYSSLGQGILTKPANGGEARVIVEETATVISPQLLPGGNQILFTLNPTTASREVVLQNLEDGTRRTLANGAMGTYLKTGDRGGHLVFWTSQPGSQLLALALDADYNPVGTPIPIINGIGGNIIPIVGLSESGTIAYHSGPNVGLGAMDGIRTLAWMDRTGQETPLPAPPDNYRVARVSPTGDRIAVQVGLQIWIWNVRNENFARLPDFGQPMEFPAWTPDGARIIFRTVSDKGNALSSIAADGSGELQHVLDTPEGANTYPYTFTPDRGSLLVTMPTPSGLRAFAVPMGSDWVASGEPRLLRESQFAMVDAALHPTGEWLVYSTLAGAEPMAFFSPYPDAGRQQIPLGPFAHPVFARSGDVLYIANAGQGLSAVSVDTTNGLKLGTPELIIPNSYYWGAQGRAWDLAPDGRFLLMKHTGQLSVDEPDETPRIRVVVNWAEELKRLVPLP